MSANFDPVRRYDIDGNIRLESTGAAVRTGAGLTSQEVCLHALNFGYVKVGGSTVTATAAAASFPMEAGERLHMKILPGQFISWITGGGTAVLFITPSAT